MKKLLIVIAIAALTSCASMAPNSCNVKQMKLEHSGYGQIHHYQLAGIRATKK